MKKPIRFSSIGAFVLGAIAILVGAILFFGSADVFMSSREYVMFFDQSVNGLSMGSPVKFRGVNVGMVSRVALSQTQKADHPQIAIFVNLHPQDGDTNLGVDGDFFAAEKLKTLIDQGLRAQLRSQSVLSGDLYLSLDMLPEEEAYFYLAADSKVPEIPTVRSGLMEELTANSVNVTRSMTSALDNLQRVLANIDRKLDPVSNSSLETMEQLKKTLKTFNEFVDPDSPLGYQLPRSLSEIEKAAKSIRILAEYLERDPSSVLFGRAKVETVDH